MGERDRGHRWCFAGALVLVLLLLLLEVTYG